MCESKVYLKKGEQEEMIFESVDRLEDHDGKIKMVDLFGEERTVTAKVKAFSLIDHKIILEPL
jgi:predicted RNA-binding protein